jgi:hypothetical protein
MLRTSSWLAPSCLSNRPCDLPARKTLNASNRYLPSNRTACTRTSCVPSSLSPLSQRGHPTETKAPRGMTGGPSVSRRPFFPLRRIVTRHSTRHLLVSRLLEMGAWAFSSHGADAIEPLTPLSRSSLVSPSRLSWFPSSCTLAACLLLGG